MNSYAMLFRRRAGNRLRFHRKRVFRVTGMAAWALALLMGLAACAGAPTSIAADGGGQGGEQSGVIVAVRLVPRLSPAIASTLASFGDAGAVRAATPVELIIALDGGGTLSVVQTGGAELAVGARVRVLAGPPPQVASSR